MDTVKISLWISNGCISSSILTLMDEFCIANLWHRYLTGETGPPLFEPHIVSTDGKSVLAQGNVRLEVEMGIDQVERTDCVVISPILPKVQWPRQEITHLSSWLKKMQQEKTLIAGVCTGSFILAETGLLVGKKATTNWQFASLFRTRFPEVTLLDEDILVEDGNVITTGAATAVNNLAIHLIKRFGSQKLASACAKALLIDSNRLSQSPYTMSIPFRSHGDDQVLDAQALIEKKFPEIQSVDEIARKVGISPRHFKRRFKKATGELPLKYLQMVRIDAAKEQLETTSKSLDEITADVGYQDVSSFCRLFRQHTRTSPKNYREKFYYRLQA